MGPVALDNVFPHLPTSGGLLLPRSLRIATKRRQDTDKEVLIAPPLSKRRRLDKQVSVISPSDIR